MLLIQLHHPLPWHSLRKGPDLCLHLKTVKYYFCPDRGLSGGTKRSCAWVCCSMWCLLLWYPDSYPPPWSTWRDIGSDVQRPDELCHECTSCSMQAGGRAGWWHRLPRAKAALATLLGQAGVQVWLSCMCYSEQAVIHCPQGGLIWFPEGG